MKKLFFLATLAVAFVLSGCNGLNKLPQDLRSIVKDMDKSFKEYFADEDDYIYKGVKVEDKNIVFTIQISEDERDGKSLKKWMKKEGISEGGLFYKTCAKLDDETDIDWEELQSLLKKHKYNIVIRFIGDNSDDKKDYKAISYKDLQKYDD